MLGKGIINHVGPVTRFFAKLALTITNVAILWYWIDCRFQDGLLSDNFSMLHSASWFVVAASWICLALCFIGDQIRARRRLTVASGPVADQIS